LQRHTDHNAQVTMLLTFYSESKWHVFLQKRSRVLPGISCFYFWTCRTGIE